MMAGAWGIAGGFAAAEVCAPLLVLCWLCCWPADDSSDSSSGKHPQNPVITDEAGLRGHSELSSRRLGSSAISLHLPSTSGTKKSLSAHRSHEEIRGRRKSHHEPIDDTRYHSAPSVIDEVVHRRDWERSTKELYIPLKPEQNDSSNEETTNSNEQIIERPCKKHYTNIKSSRKKEVNKELLNEDIKDNDATEGSPSFYIGETETNISNDIVIEDNTKIIYKAKESKQYLNESIKSKERQMPILTLTEYQAGLEKDNIDKVDVVDRSGAIHHSIESPSSFTVHPVSVPPPSVEAVGYDSDVSYLAEDDVMGAWRMDSAGVATGAGTSGRFWGRARHGSAGDVLAPTLRPHSAALSESDLDFELDECDEAPPAYDQLHLLTSRDRKETAI